MKDSAQVEAIIKAVRKHVALQIQPIVPYLADSSKESDITMARVLIIGLSNMYGVHHTETCTWLCCEDGEYKNLLLRFDKYVCQPVTQTSPIVKNGLAGKYILKYRKVANELNFHGVSPYVGSKYFEHSPGSRDSL